MIVFIIALLILYIFFAACIWEAGDKEFLCKLAIFTILVLLLIFSVLYAMRS